MHMADAMLSPAVGVTMYALSGIAVAYSIKKIRKEEDFKKNSYNGNNGSIFYM